MSDMIRRVWIDGKLVREEETNDTSVCDAEIFLKGVVEEAGDRPLLVELEFLDEPNQNERFVRFGTDKARMVNPIQISLPKEPIQ